MDPAIGNIICVSVCIFTCDHVNRSCSFSNMISKYLFVGFVSSPLAPLNTVDDRVCENAKSVRKYNQLCGDVVTVSCKTHNRRFGGDKDASIDEYSPLRLMKKLFLVVVERSLALCLSVCLSICVRDIITALNSQRCQ